MAMFLRAGTGHRDLNGTVRAKCVPRKTTRLSKRSKNIVAIDFGTKNCSVAFITENDQLEITRGIPKLPLNGTYLRVPTVVLFNQAGQVEAFGHDARTLYANLEDHEREEYTYFEEMKMNLHHDKDVRRELRIKAMNGRSFFLVDVIGHIIKYLKEEFLHRHLQRGGHSFRISDFEWVITVPAIWKSRGKQLMREAGYKAGLCSQQPFSRLIVASDTLPSIPIELAPDRLSLALEPESASLYCHEMLKRGLVAPFCDNPSGPFAPHSYLLVDIGGGTVDISAHKVIDRNENNNPVIEELHIAVGNDCGGTRVNQQFAKFLEGLVDDTNFSKFIETADVEVNIRNKCELNHLINVVFEEQKLVFGRLPVENRREVVVQLPVSMLDIYEQNMRFGIKTAFSSHAKLVRQNLRISAEKMEQFFEPVMSGTISCIKEVLHNVGELIDVIYLVGGFGGCPYIYSKMLNEFGISYRCIVPPNPEFAVVEGSVLFHADPTVIQSRRADATYGKSVIRPFDSKIHDISHRFLDDDNMPFCDDLFQVIVEVGDIVHPRNVYTCTSQPTKKFQKNMCIEIFRSPYRAEETWYVLGVGSGEIEKIGELVIDFSEQKSDKSREVNFFFDFSHTEIQVTAYDKSSGYEIKAVIDFL